MNTKRQDANAFMIVAFLLFVASVQVHFWIGFPNIISFMLFCLAGGIAFFASSLYD